MNRRFHTLLGLAVSVIVLVAVFWNVEWHELGEHLRNVSWRWAPHCAVVFAVQYWLRSLRWRLLLRGGEGVPLGRAFDAMMLGNFATFVLPLRAGEFVRPFALSRWTELSFPACFVSVAIERFFDLSCVLLSFALFVSQVPNVPALAFQGAMSLGALALAILAFIVFGTLMPQRLLALSDYSLRLAPAKLRAPVRKFLADFLHGCDVLRSPITIVLVTCHTALIWAATYLLFYLFLLFCNLPAGGWLSVGTGVLVALAVAAPSAPGFLGVYEGGVVAAFALFGLSHSAALAYGLITHVVNYVVFCVYGVVILLRSNMRWSELAAVRGPKLEAE